MEKLVDVLQAEDSVSCNRFALLV